MSERSLIKFSAKGPPPLTPLGESGEPNGDWDYHPSLQTNILEPDQEGRTVSGRPADRKRASVTILEGRITNAELGDRSTWLLIALMCLLGLLIAGAAYWLPYGRHADFPPIKVY